MLAYNTSTMDPSWDSYHFHWCLPIVITGVSPNFHVLIGDFRSSRWWKKGPSDWGVIVPIRSIRRQRQKWQIFHTAFMNMIYIIWSIYDLYMIYIWSIYDLYMIYIWSILYDLYYMIYIIWSILYDLYYMIYIIWSILYDLYYMIYIIWSILYDLYYMIYIIWSILYDLYYMIYIIWSILYDLYMIYIWSIYDL